MKLVVFSAIWLVVAIVGTALMATRVHNGTGSGWLVSYLVAVNLVTFVLYVYDKIVSQVLELLHLDWLPLRIPEAVLIWGLAFFGGLPGAALGMAFAGHKTKKAEFQSELSLAGFLSVACAAALYFGITRWHWLTLAAINEFVAVSAASVLDAALEIAPPLGRFLG
jgi:uncharacterized membrane protein YsdA (DUF1294 family)